MDRLLAEDRWYTEKILTSAILGSYIVGQFVEVAARCPEKNYTKRQRLTIRNNTHRLRISPVNGMDRSDIWVGAFFFAVSFSLHLNSCDNDSH